MSSKSRTIVFISVALCGLKSFFHGLVFLFCYLFLKMNKNFRLLQHSAGLTSWSLLGTKFGLTAAYVALAFHAYALYRSQPNPVHIKRH